MPSATVMNPNATWMNETMTIGLSPNDVPGEPVKLMREGTITYSIVIMCSTTAAVIVIPCWRNIFLFFNVTAIMSRARTVICIAKLIVASTKETMVITKLSS